MTTMISEQEKTNASISFADDGLDEWRSGRVWSDTARVLPRQSRPVCEETMSDITDTLKQRGFRYGDFGEHARITQSLKDAMICSPSRSHWIVAPPMKTEPSNA